MAKFLQTPFFIEHVRWYLSISSYLSKIMWDGFYYKGLHIWSEFVIYILLVETIPTSFYWLTCRKQKLVQSKALQQRLFVLMLGFWQCRQAFVHYLMSLLMIWKWTRGYIYQVVAMEFAFAATCSDKIIDSKNFLYTGTNNWIYGFRDSAPVRKLYACC